MKIRLILCLTLVLSASFTSNHLEAQSFRQIIQDGDPLPGGEVFDAGGLAALNDRGDVLLRHRSSQGGDGLYLARNGGSIAKIFQSGDPSPDGNGVIDGFHQFFRDSPVLNNNGHVAYLVEIAPVSGADETAVIYWDGEQNHLVAREGDPALDNNGQFFISFSQTPLFNDSNRVVFRALFQNSTIDNDGALMQYDFNARRLSEIIRNDDRFAGETVSSTPILGRSIDQQGNVIFRMTTVERNVDGVLIGGTSGRIVRGSSSGLIELFNRDDELPEMGSVNVGVISSDNLGRVGFTFDYSRMGTRHYGAGIFSGGSLISIAVEDDLIPGTDIQLDEPCQVVVSDSGAIWFVAKYTFESPRTTGIFRSVGGGIQTVARPGNLDPWGDEISSVSFSQANDSGQIALALRSTTVTDTSRNSLVLFESGEAPVPIIVQGQTLFGSTVTGWTGLSNLTIGFTSDTLFPNLQFNNSGQLVINYRLDGSSTDFPDGVAVWSPANVVAAPVLGDVSMDGVVDFLDISPFIAVLSAGGNQAEGDINRDGEVNFLDISPFIQLLSSQ